MGTTYRVRARRSGGWWAIDAPAMPGLHSQARRIDQVEAMARDALALLLDVDPASFAVEVDLELPEAWARVVADARQARTDADAAEKTAQATVRGAAQTLLDAGLSMRDVGSIMGVSHQRVAQLVAAGGAR